MLDWSAILKNLANSIEQRLNRSIQTTEDTVRYYFFLELLGAGISPEQMVLERSHPHPALRGKEIDLTIIRPDGFWDFELKYHRPIPSGHTRPLTQLRGQLISDLFKLAMSDSQRGYLLYLADPQMAAHWENAMPPSTRGANVPILLTPNWLQAQSSTIRTVIQKNIATVPNDLVVCAQVRACRVRKISAWLYESPGNLARVTRFRP